MDELLNIIEITDGRFVLNAPLLHSALESAENCDYISLISIIGPKSHGKTFFIKCLINYMNSEDKDKWPHCEDAFINYNTRSYDYDIPPVIQLTSSPLKIRDETGNRTAIFLMDSDFDDDFDSNITSKQFQDIIEIFLLTSSTVIYNHKQNLPPQEFSELKTISSRIASFDLLKSLVFLIRDWSPETKDNDFSYGLYGGSKYIEKLMANMHLEESHHEWNGFLMSAPEMDTQTNVIKLCDLNKQFLLDLKEIIDFKLFNIDEMPKKKNPNTNKYINANELFELFNKSVEKFNHNEYDMSLVESSSARKENQEEDIQVCNYEKELCRNKSDSENNVINHSLSNGFNTTPELNSYNHTSKTNGPIPEKEEGLMESTEKKDLMLFHDNDNSLSLDEKTDEFETNSNDLCNRNKSATEKSNFGENEKSNSIDVSDDTENESSIVCCSSESSEDSSDYPVDDNNSFTWENSTNEDEIDNSYVHVHTTEVSSITLISQNKNKTNETDLKESDEKNNLMFKTTKEIEDKNDDDVIKVELFFEELVNKLLLKYNEKMKMKLKDQIWDSERDLFETDEKIKLKIFQTFEKNSYDIKPIIKTPNYKAKYLTSLTDKLEEALKIYKSEVESNLTEARNQYQKVLQHISSLYISNMESSIMNQMKDDPHMRGLSNIQRVSKEIALKTFKEETDKFFKGNIETEFLNKLIEEINQINYCFETICDHYRTFESESQKIFSNFKYYSVEKIEQFYKNQISGLNDSLQKIRYSDLIKFTVSLFDKSLNVLKERNNSIEDKEQFFADKAIDLAYKKYENCLEAKIRTGFFAKDQLNNICDKLLKYTIKEFIDSCDFNQYQNNLIDYCKNKITFKAEEINKRKLNGYQEKINSTKNMLNKAIEESFGVYCYSMNEKSSTVQSKTHLNSREFTELHHKYSEMAIEKFNKLAEFLNIDYDPEYVRNIILEHESLLKNLIKNKKQKLKTLNDKNTPDIHSVAVYLGKQYIIAATHRNGIYEIISDKFKQKLRPNSISFGNEILIGTEAKNHYENTFPDNVSFKNYDIKQLLARERSLVSEEELKAYPFTFHREKLSVIVDYEGHNIDLYIESLLAFMILDIKLCAEKQIQNIMSNIVLTVPTNYTINQKNAIRNAAKIAGFEHCDVISEVSAAAIGYVVERADFLNKIMDNVLFVVINDYECDFAICTITNKKIKYKIYLYQNLISIEEKNKFGSSKITNRRYEENDEYTTESKFKDSIDKVLEKALVKSVQIDECVIAGNSVLISEIKIWIEKYVNLNSNRISESQDIIVKGSAIYGEMLANKIDFIETVEITTHDIKLNFENEYLKEDRFAGIFSGLSDEDLREEERKLSSLMNKEKSCLEEDIIELSNYCTKVKDEVDNNLELRPLIKKQILLELEKTKNYLKGEHLNSNDISKRKQMLDSNLEQYLQR